MKCLRVAACVAFSTLAVTNSNAQSTGQLLSRQAYPTPVPTSYVTIYGIIDTSVGYISNSNGGKLVAVQSAKQAPNFFGFTGSENLGGGNIALFKIEQGLTLNTGTTFPRENYVGLSNTHFGTVTLGRHVDFSGYLTRFTGGRFANAVDTMHLGNYDGVAGRLFNNAIVYRSPVVGPFEFATMYSFGDSATGTTNTGRVFEGMASFVQGPWSGVAVYEGINGLTLTPYSIGVPTFFNRTLTPTTSVFVDKSVNIGAGVAYQLGAFNLHGMFTRNRMTTGANTQTLSAYDGGIGWTANPATFIGAGYSYQMLTGSANETPHWSQVGLAVDYFLSKRTDLFLGTAYMWASGRNVRAAFAFESPSSTSRQAMVRAGMRIFF